MSDYNLFSNYSLSGTGEYLKEIEKYVLELNQTLEIMPFHIIDQVITVLHEARMTGKQVFIMGNGGSAATASHFVADLAKNTRVNGFPGFRVFGLTDNMPVFSALANDEGYENVFSGQLGNFLNPRDVVIAISGSGNSMNVVKAIEFANQKGAQTIGFTGFDGGKLGKLTRININIANNKIQQVEDAHMALVHIISDALRDTAIRMNPNEFKSRDISEKNSGSPAHSSEGDNKREINNLMDQINFISRQMANSLNLHELLPKILSLTLDMVGAISGSILVLDESGEIIDGALVYSGEEQQVSKEYLREIKDNGLAEWVIKNRQSALVSSTREDIRWLQRAWDQDNNSSRSALSVPLMSKDRVVGVLTLVHPQVDRFNIQDLALLTAVTVSISYSVSSSF